MLNTWRLFKTAGIALWTIVIAVALLRRRSSLSSAAIPQIVNDASLSYISYMGEVPEPKTTIGITSLPLPPEATPDFKTEIWPGLKRALCPNMVPNVELAQQRLFHLARERIGYSSGYDEHLEEGDSENHVYQKFFKFRAALHEYTSGVDDNVMVYVGIWKGANEQIRFGMNESLGSAFNFQGNMKFEKMLLEKLPKLTKHTPCLVTAVRDPISHFLSGYNEVEERYTWPLYGIDYEDQYSKLLFTRLQHGTTERFEQFVADLLSGPIVTMRKPPLNIFPLKLTHIYLMSGFLVQLAKYNTTLTAYLPSLQNLTDTWPPFVSSSCPNVTFPEDFAKTPLKLTGQHDSSNDKLGDYAAAKEVWKEGGGTAQALCVLHIMDYACFDKLEIPEVCQYVYGRRKFVTAITSDTFDP